MGNPPSGTLFLESPFHKAPHARSLRRGSSRNSFVVLVLLGFRCISSSVSRRTSTNWVVVAPLCVSSRFCALNAAHPPLSQSKVDTFEGKMLGFQEPLDCRTSYSGVLDLRTVRVGSIAASWSSEPPVSPPTGGRELTPSPRDRELTRSPSECSVLTPPRDTSLSPPMLDVVSPTLAITQRVLAAASTPQGTRPFKAYPKDPLTLSAQSDAYLQFRQHMLNQVRGTKQHAKKRPASPTSPYDRQNQQNQQQQPTSSGHESDDKDAAYWERRRKNNEAAKRSRDARRAKEDEIAIRAAFLEQENLRLKYQVAALNDETTKLRCLLYKSDSTAQIRLKSESNLPQNFFKPDSSGQTFFKPESHAPQMLYKPDSSGPHNFYNPDSHSPQMLFKSEHHPKQILYKSECATGI